MCETDVRGLNIPWIEADPVGRTRIFLSMATSGRVTDALVETQNATDPTSDPAEAITTGVEGLKATSTPPPADPHATAGPKGATCKGAMGSLQVSQIHENREGAEDSVEPERERK